MRASRLYPPSGGATIQILVFPDQDALIEWVEGIDGDREAWVGPLWAVCVTLPEDKIVLAFHEERLDIGTITHECLHAALSRARSEGWAGGVAEPGGDWASPAEERLARLVDRLVVQVVRRLKGWGLWRG
jgi:hypothetical protein